MIQPSTQTHLFTFLVCSLRYRSILSSCHLSVHKQSPWSILSSLQLSCLYFINIVIIITNIFSSIPSISYINLVTTINIHIFSPVLFVPENTITMTIIIILLPVQHPPHRWASPHSPPASADVYRPCRTCRRYTPRPTWSWWGGCCSRAQTSPTDPLRLSPQCLHNTTQHHTHVSCCWLLT